MAKKEHEDGPKCSTRIDQNNSRGVTKYEEWNETKKDEEEDRVPKTEKESGAFLALIFDMRRSRTIISSYQLSVRRAFTLLGSELSHCEASLHIVGR